MDRKGVIAVERVYRKNIRPQPPQANQREGWNVGDMVEVFDSKCWKVGKVAKVATNDRVVIRFLGSIQPKEFDECNLRIRQAWHQNKRSSVTEKVQKKNKIKIGSSYRSSDSKGQLEVDKASVGSCSFNKLSDTQNESSAELGEDVGDTSDAESSFPSLSGKKLSAPLPEPDMLDAGIHKLELQAYKSTLQVLYASGPLSWEQESLLTNLRLSLHITNEEHLQHLRHLLSSQVL